MTMTLVEFLRRQVSEDETNADTWGDLGVTFGGVQLPPERWRAEITAKQRILVMYETALATVDMVPRGMLPSEPLAVSARAILITTEAAAKILAAAYADRLGYREEWAAL